MKKFIIPASIILVLAVFSLIYLYFKSPEQLQSVNSNVYKSPEADDDTINTNSSPIQDKDSSAPLKDLKVLSECVPDKLGLKYEVLSGDKISDGFSGDHNFYFNPDGSYSKIPGIPCFRGNNLRNSAAYGTCQIDEKKLQKVWSIKIGHIDTWTGVGWTGQPAIIKWPDDVKNIMNITSGKKAKNDLKEVIYATLDGNIYFLDLDDGAYTRGPIITGYSHKGSVSVDPRGYPLLYAGQGIEQVHGKNVPCGYRIFSLIDFKPLYFIDGYDSYALRKWPAFDSNGLLDAASDTFLECGENGVLYSIKLNTDFNKENKNISIAPNVAKYRYTAPQSPQLGTENSPAFYKNLIFFADNSGLLQCVDMNTLKPQWARFLGDDTDSSIAIEEESGNPYLYTACEVDRQGSNGESHIRKINALTGEVMWENAFKCFYDANTNGGALASPVIGKNSIKDLVIFNIARTGSKTGGKLVAYNKKTGHEAWSVDLKYYCWSSPVDIYGADGKAHLIVCDSGCNMSLYDAESGKLEDVIGLEGIIEGSPAVYDDMVVVGTRGQKIWGIRIK